MKDLFNALKDRPWFLPLVFSSGLLLGLLIGRILLRSPADDLLTALALLTVGLAVAFLLITAGWLLATDRAPDEARAVSRASEQETETTRHIVQESPRSAPAVAPLTEDEATVSSALEPKLIPASPIPPVPADRHVVIRLRHIPGYSLVQIKLGYDGDWLGRVSSPAGRAAAVRTAAQTLRRAEALPWLLFAGSLLVYAITRLFALDQFPINFFADEAIQVTNAVDLVNRGFRDPQGGLFPMYFNVFFFVNPDIAVYLHAITASLFGESINVARATSSLLTLFAAGAVGLVMKRVFRLETWWVVVLLLAVTPVWFLHSRTAFDAVTMTSLYALFIVTYLLYRYHSPRWLYPAVIFAAATFYAYPSGQVAIALLALFVIVSDVRYHWKNRRTVFFALPLIFLLAIPFIRFELLHPGEATYHLSQVNSYWAANIPLQDKLGRFAGTYLELLSPTYWFLPNELDLARQRMKDYTLLPLIALPFLLIGIVVCLRNLRDSKYRTVLVAGLVSNIGGALVDIGILRTLAFVIPVAIVSALGLEWAFQRIRTLRWRTIAAVAVFAVLSVMSLWMLDDALTNGPTWFTDYTLYGMQWGTKQIFQETVPQLAGEHPDSTIYVSHTWANGTDVFVPFFHLQDTNVQMASILSWLEKKLPLDPGSIFIMTPDEYKAAAGNPKLKDLSTIGTIPYPDGRDGFYITQVSYSDAADQIFQQEAEALKKPVTEDVVIDGQTASVSHTKFDIGNLDAIFDGDSKTVARGVEANPLVLDVKFQSPRKLQSLEGYFGRADINLDISLYGPSGDQPEEYQQQYDYLSTPTEMPAGQAARIAFDRGPDLVSRAYIEIHYTNDGEGAHVHVFDLQFR